MCQKGNRTKIKWGRRLGSPAQEMKEERGGSFKQGDPDGLPEKGTSEQRPEGSGRMSWTVGWAVSIPGSNWVLAIQF